MLSALMPESVGAQRAEQGPGIRFDFESNSRQESLLHREKINPPFDLTGTARLQIFRRRFVSDSAEEAIGFPYPVRLGSWGLSSIRLNRPQRERLPAL